MILSRSTLYRIQDAKLELPNPEVFGFPEKILQFGTGVLLRGLIDFYIDQANKKGVFKGRIAIVKSTEKGDLQEFKDQDNLYTLYLKGIENSEIIEKKLICASISRVLNASKDWALILEIAASDNLQIVVSNTTEVGISWMPELIHENPPSSFPGKLLAVLYHRFTKFQGSKNHGLVIIPTELIPNNGNQLKDIVLRLAEYNCMQADFLDWVNLHNTFSNSLVDRIVPGRPDPKTEKDLEEIRGYTDSLNIIAEPFNLWAIEGDPKLAEILTFAECEKGVLIRQDIEIFRELKLRILNGSHTIGCGLALISGFKTVREAMEDPGFSHFMEGLIFDETIDSIPYAISMELKVDFAKEVLDRFRNPFIAHEWKNISVQFSSKMKLRIVPLILRYYQNQKAVPKYMALGFAAFIRWMKVKQEEKDVFRGFFNNQEYIIKDDQAAYFSQIWNQDISSMVEAILTNKNLWDTDLNLIDGLKEAILHHLIKIMKNESLNLQDF